VSENGSVEHALAALLRGVGEFGYRSGSGSAPLESLERFLKDQLPWLSANPRGADVIRIALSSYRSDSTGGRLLAAIWDAASSAGAAVERMRAPLSMVFNPTGPYQAQLAPIAWQPDKIFPTDGTGQSQSVAELFTAFSQALGQFRGGELPALAQTVLTALETYAWSVPATGFSDVSIFEFSRSVAAIVGTIGAGAQAVEQLDYLNTPLLLALGDLGGIQTFLYAIVTSKAARMLRGRSLGLQLIADAIANRLLARFDLPVTSLLYSGGGKFWLLMPAAAEAQLEPFSQQIDLELCQSFASRLSFGIGWTLTTARELIKATSRVWHRATEDLSRRRERRFSTLLTTSYEQVFDPFGGEQACKVCGMPSTQLAPLSSEDDDRERLACPACRDFVELGRRATATEIIVRQPRDIGSAGQPLFRYSPPVSTDDYVLYGEGPPSGALPQATVLWVNRPPVQLQGPCGHAIWLAGLNRALSDNGEALDFDELARRSQGIKRLGILRMDVDSLGRIFREGLGDDASLARVAALSRHLSYFFGGYLSHLLSQAPDTCRDKLQRQAQDTYRDKLQVIYAGGDDVFIVGAWSKIPLIAERIRADFARFTGNNPVWGISAGVEIVPARFPIAAAAQRAGEAEERAKRFRRFRSDLAARDKDAICLFDEVLDWHDFAALKQCRDRLQELFGGTEPLLPRATLRTLHAIACAAREAKVFGEVYTALEAAAAVRRGKWAWLAAYAVARAVGPPEARKKLHELYDALAHCRLNGITATEPILKLLKPAAEWVDLLNRERST